MRSAGLKGHIIITLILLLATAMLLANLVITLFWEQTLIRAEAQRVKTVLALEAQRHSRAAGEQVTSDLNATARSLREHLGTVCLLLLDSDGMTSDTDPSCDHAAEVKSAVSDTSASRSPVTRPLGSTWSLFTARPEFLLVAVPLPGSPPRGGIGAITSLKPIYAQVRQKQKPILVYLLVNILLLGTIGFFRLVKSTVRPVEQLVRLTEAHDEAGEFDLFPGREASEFGQLSASLNRMTRRIDDDRRRLRETVASLEAANRKLQQAQQDMVRAEKLAAVGRLSAGLAHEIGNPIGIVQGYLELLQRDNLAREDRLQFSQRAIGELDRINRLIRQLLDFARTAPPGTQQVAINELLQTLVEMFRTHAKMDRIAFLLHLDAENDLVAANEETIRQVFLNCLLNSVDAISDRGEDFAGEITLATRNLEGGTTGELEISVRDNGGGIDPAYLNNIFDPFFTTKEPGKGTGLGLAVSHTIIEAAGGRIEAQSEVGGGTELRITLPLTGRYNMDAMPRTTKAGEPSAPAEKAPADH